MTSYDLFSPKFKSDPFPTFAAMRRNHPVYPHQAPDGSTIWYVTRYDDVSAILRDNDHFVKDRRNALPPAQRSHNAPKHIHDSINENMLFSDPPAHTRLRALVNQAFTPRRVAALGERVTEIAAALLDEVVERGEMDLIEAFALPLPVQVICELLGIPAADRERVSDWSQAIISPGSRNITYSARKRKVRELVFYLRELFAARREAPQDDLITALVEAEEAGERLNEAELSSMVVLLLVTGHETTVNLIGNGALALMRHPAQRAWLERNPGRVETAVEELLRFDGPVETSTTRWLGCDYRFRRHLMRRGDVMRVVLASANRDPAHFSEPDTLNLARPAAENRHLAFGQGIHYCLGAPLARLEGRVAFNVLLDRLPGLRLAVSPGELAWRSGVLFRGLEALPLRWDSPPAITM